MNRAKKDDCTLEIYLADPNSPDVEMRLIEEELGDSPPPVGQLGLFRRLKTLMHIWERSGFSESISINLFTNYPTFALVIVDDDYFFYPYGYATVGNFSPVLQLSSKRHKDEAIIRFLNSQYKRIKNSALDAREVFAVRKKKKNTTETLYPFAVYFIPQKDTDLYKFGSDVLGYDIHKRESLVSPWPEQVGNAVNFGFHLTLTDVLYFYNLAEIQRVKAEVEFLAQELRAFSITDLRVSPC